MKLEIRERDIGRWMVYEANSGTCYTKDGHWSHTGGKIYEKRSLAQRDIDELYELERGANQS